MTFSCQEGKKSTRERKELVLVKSQFKTSNSYVTEKQFPAINQLIGVGRIGEDTSKLLFDSLKYWDYPSELLRDPLSRLEVFVDTINSIPFELCDSKVDLKDSTSYKIDSVYIKNGRECASFRGNPVYVINRDSISNGLELVGNSVFMIAEAKDSTGHWKPLEFWFEGAVICGNTYVEREVKPESYFLFSTPSHEGDFKTKLRFKLRNFGNTYYSNEFDGFIDYQQFDCTAVVKLSRWLAEVYYFHDKPIIENQLDSLSMEEYNSLFLNN